MIDCEFDTLILSLVLIWIFYVFNFNLQLSEVIHFKNEPPLNFLQKIFHETSPMYEEYWISNEVAKVIEPYLCEKLDINNYDYFLSCEEENISYLKE